MVAGRGLVILIGIIALLCLAAYVVRAYAPAVAVFLLTLAVLLILLIVAATTGLVPIASF